MVMSQLDQYETLLILLTQEGDVAAFEELLRRLYGPLRQYVTRLVGESNADDVLQDAAIRIYKKIRFLREPAVFKAWAFRIATRIAAEKVQKIKQRVVLGLLFGALVWWAIRTPDPGINNFFVILVVAIGIAKILFRIDSSTRAILRALENRR